MNKRKLNRYLGLALMTGLINQQKERPILESVEVKEKRTIIPAGANYYHFYSDGTFSINDLPFPFTVFSCIARSDKKAKAKFTAFSKNS